MFDRGVSVATAAVSHEGSVRRARNLTVAGACAIALLIVLDIASWDTSWTEIPLLILALTAIWQIVVEVDRGAGPWLRKVALMRPRSTGAANLPERHAPGRAAAPAPAGRAAVVWAAIGCAEAGVVLQLAGQVAPRGWGGGRQGTLDAAGAVLISCGLIVYAAITFRRRAIARDVR